MVLREKALRGDARALDRLLELAVRFNNDGAEIGPAQALSADDQAILAAYVAEISAVAMTPATADPPDDPTSKPGAGVRQEGSQMNDHAALAALLRSDLRSFVWKSFQTILPGTPYLPNWHIDAIVHQLMRVQAGDISRLLINQPPRSLKSICVSVAYVAWLLGHDPTRRVIVVSYANELAAELHRQFRMVIDAAWYRALFPAMRPARDSGTELVTTAGGSRYATSVGGTLTGRGADLIIIDDPLKAEEAMSEPARKRVIDWYRRHPGVAPQRQGERSHRRCHAAPARKRPCRPSAWSRWLGAPRPAVNCRGGQRHSPRPRQSDDTTDRRHPASGAREQRRSGPHQGGDRQPEVLGAVSAAAGSSRRQSHSARLVPIL